MKSDISSWILSVMQALKDKEPIRNCEKCKKGSSSPFFLESLFYVRMIAWWFQESAPFLSSFHVNQSVSNNALAYNNLHRKFLHFPQTKAFLVLFFCVFRFHVHYELITHFSVGVLLLLYVGRMSHLIRKLSIVMMDSWILIWSCSKEKGKIKLLSSSIAKFRATGSLPKK